MATKILYIATAGAADATRASIPLHLAVNGSVEVGQETANRLEGVGVPSVRELMAKLLEHEIPVYV